jgi:hypothetical protein
MWNRISRMAGAAGAALTLVACGSGDQTAATTTDHISATTTIAADVPTAPTAPPATAEPLAKNWFDLDVGDCLVDLPKVDLGEVSVGVVDCTIPHGGEVFLRAPVEVNAAIADVADQQCAAGIPEYTGRQSGDDLTVTYLIDSNQDRTSDNPLPSTVICLLQAGGGQQLTGSARRH